LNSRGELLLGLRDRIGAGNEPEWRMLFLGDPQQGLSELRRITGLLAVLALRGVALSRVTLGVVLDD
jgi:hypothetical protein